MICTKARRLVGMLYRQFYQDADTSTLKQLYICLTSDLILKMPVRFGTLTYRNATVCIPDMYSHAELLYTHKK